MTTTTDPLQESLLRWGQSLLGSRALQDLAAALAAPPGTPDEMLTGVLVLPDPRHELRLLAVGDEPGRTWPGIQFVDALEGVAPLYASLQAPWSGEYRAADHGLLFAPLVGCTHVTLLPLPRGASLSGVYNVAARGTAPSIAGLDGAWQQHLASLVLAAVERWFQRARLMRAGVVDPVTGWNSRHYFDTRLRELVAACLRRGESASCAVIDVDHLGTINERYGVTAGDATLFEIGNRIEAQVRGSDAFAHLGDDAFVVLLPDTGAALAASLAERVLTAVRATPIAMAHGEELQVRVSIGIAELDPSRLGVEVERKALADQWFAEAETALHQAKRDGGDRCAFSFAGAASGRGK